LGNNFSISGRVWQEAGFAPGRVTVSGTKIAAVEFGDNLPADYSFPDHFICPGLVDIQLNGGVGHDFTLDPSSVGKVAEALPRWGVTAFLPTYITAPLETYREAIEQLKQATGVNGAKPVGAHFEGPFLNPAFKGAHEEQYIRLPSIPEAEKMLETGGALLKMVTLAPEREGGYELAAFLAGKGLLVSAGHSAANYEEAQKAFASGVRCVTHLFNAMPPLHHRRPGLAGAALTNPDVTVNIIPDGIHLQPSIVEMIYRLKGSDRIVLTTDAMAGMGMPPGRYRLAGQDVIVDETSARLTDAAGTLAGSVLTLNNAVANFAEFTGCPLHEAVKMAALNPARLLKMDNTIGNLKPGHEADIAVFSQSFETRLTIISGENFEF
jgi:N-acetylglucosamine-6-phosphate deacetylase